MHARFVVTGTDTAIGKTVFAAALCHAIGAAYWKPVQAGLEGETDTETVARLGQIPPERCCAEGWRLKTPASPHLSARLDDVQIKQEEINVPKLEYPLVIEGAGGLLVPLNAETVFADLFAMWGIPVILCARTTLGTINHTLLSLEALRHRMIPVLGVAFIGDAHEETEAIIGSIGRVKRLGCLPYMPDLTPETLHQRFIENFDLKDFGRYAC